MKRRFWVLFLIALVGFCSLLYKAFYDEAKERAINSLNTSRRLHARQAALGIEDYLNQHDQEPGFDLPFERQCSLRPFRQGNDGNLL